MKKLLSYILALALFASPAYGQIIPRSGGAGGGGGGGGDASAANQTTQIGALPLEDTASGTGDRGTAVHHVRRDTLIADASVDADGDYTHSFVDNRGARWVHNDPKDAQLDLQVAASTTGNGTTIDVSGVNLLFVHAESDGSWNRTGSLFLEGFMGGGGISEPRELPYIEWQTSSAADRPVGRTGGAITLNANPSTHTGWWVDVRGFQGFRARLSITGGSTGTISIHAHAVKNGEGIHNAAMALTIANTGATGIPDWSLQVAGRDPAMTTTRILPVSTVSGTFAAGNLGYPIHGFTNADGTTVDSSEDRYLPVAVEDAGWLIGVGAYSPHLPTNRVLGKLEDTTHADGDAGVPTWGTHNEALATYATTADDYVPDARERTGVGIRSLIYGNLSAANQIGKLEDSPSGNGHPGIPFFAVRNDNAATSFGGGDLDYTWIAVTEQGEQFKASSGNSFFAITDTAIAAASQNFPFGFTSKKVMVAAPSGNGANVCVDWGGGTAVCPAADTAGDDLIKPGESIILEDFKGTSISAISATGTVTITVRAWN